MRRDLPHSYRCNAEVEHTGQDKVQRLDEEHDTEGIMAEVPEHEFDGDDA
jgi:hypothetical protein